MKRSAFRTASITTFLVVFSLSLAAQTPPAKVVAGIPVNYDEALIGSYTLPDPLIMADGSKVKNAKEWIKKRRPEIVSLIEKYEYGKCPSRPAEMSFNVFDNGTPALGGKAIRKQVTIYFTKDTSDHKMDLLIYLPARATKPVPLFFNVSFSANISTVDDPGIKPGMTWSRDGKKVPASARGGFGRMNIDQFLSEGIGVATVYYGDIEPDFAKGISYGIRGYYLKPGQKYPAPDEWGAISAWSWGLSRAMDYFETDKSIDSKKIALFGVSRIGKTVLWTGARDQRFAMVIASCSGEGGAAVARRNYGETIRHMSDSTRYFYQFCTNYASYGKNPAEWPVEANLLVSLLAPRPLLLQTGDTDYWSDPKGEFVAAVGAEPVYNLLGKKGLGITEMPPAGKPVLNDLGYYMHAGGHGAMPADYPVFINFIKMHFFKNQ